MLRLINHYNNIQDIMASIAADIAQYSEAQYREMTCERPASKGLKDFGPQHRALTPQSSGPFSCNPLLITALA